MKFNEVLEQYINKLNCSYKEIANRSGFSPSVISRYKTGERLPEASSENVIALAKALSSLAKEKQIDGMDEGNILLALNEAILSNTIDYSTFIERFNILCNTLNLNMKRIASYTKYDVSFLYRLRSEERRVNDPIAFSNAIASYIIENHSSYEDKEKIACILQIESTSLHDAPTYQKIISKWLIPNMDATSDSFKIHKPMDTVDTSSFLTKLDEFDLEDYIKVIHFDDIKVPILPFHFPSNKTYYGIKQMCEGELDFFKFVVTSKATKSILMCSDMPLNDMAQDMDFNKKWMFAIACAIKKGIHLDMVHYLERPFEELLLGLEAWIPIYMTGLVSPYYIPNYAAKVYHHLDYISEVAALHGECMDGFHNEGKYVLTNNKDEINYYQNRKKSILKHAIPLMQIFDSNSKEQYNEFLNKDITILSNRKTIHSSLPIYTISEELLDEILNDNNISKNDIKEIKNHRLKEIERIKQKLNQFSITDVIYVPSIDEYNIHPIALDTSGIFYEKPIIYSYEQMLSHINETKQFVDINKNYHLEYSQTSTFRNIKIEMVEDQYVVISKMKSPSIHFIIKHPRLVNALQNFSVPLIETK